MGLLRGLPKGIFRGEERYGAQVDMCHFGLVGSGNPNPSNFRATHMAAATLEACPHPLGCRPQWVLHLQWSTMVHMV